MTERQKVIQALFIRLDRLEVRYFYADLEGKVFIASSLKRRINEVMAMLDTLLH